ncbi:MFS transporter [Legionella lytica]|uniref:MFS transporter n=1 Tax=Legionella lytica TaxID=96232 RepID=A0ABY4Y8B9_9GAMM|nr:MFS transporter [Legionella lytica]USQ13888.1 MFS transporter [Legionella lytica]
MSAAETRQSNKSWFKSLLPLTLGGFSIGMTEYLMMGVLPDVANSLSLSIPTAGYLIAIYAFGVVIGAPLMIALAQNYAPKKILVLLMLLFVVFNALFSMAPTFSLLLVARFMAGLPHGAFFGVGAVVATQLAKPGKGASAVAIMFTGLTVANIIGVPLGTFIGHHCSWRVAYFIVASFGVVTLFSIIKWLPNLVLEKTVDFRQSLSIFKDLEIWLIIGISAIGTGGLFAWISYIAPLMTDVTLFSGDMVTFIMMLAGSGMAVGNILGGRLADKLSPLQVTGIMLLLMILCLFTVATVAEYKIAALIMTFVTGAIAFAVVPAMQMLMIQAAQGAEILASSMVQASSNMGNTLGAYLGGLPIAAGFGYTSPEYVGMGLVFIGLVLCGLIWLTRLETAVMPGKS